MTPTEASTSTQKPGRVSLANVSGPGTSGPLVSTAPPAAQLTAPSTLMPALPASEAAPAPASASETASESASASLSASGATTVAAFSDSAPSASSGPLAYPGNPATEGFTAPLSRNRRVSGASGCATGQPEAERVRRELAAESILGLWQSRCSQERTGGGAGRESPKERNESKRSAR